MPFDLNQEKMLCLMVLDDEVAQRHMSTAPGTAYFRAFILEDRVSHKVHAQFRYCYEDGMKSWYKLDPRPASSPHEAMKNLEAAIHTVLKIALSAFGAEDEEVDNAVQSFYPPDDEGDGMRTVLWLKEQDLVSVAVEMLKEDHDSGTDQ